MKRVIACVVLISFTLSGCVQAASKSDSAKQSNQSSKQQNLWVNACEDYKSDYEAGFHEAYDQVIRDICSTADPEKIDTEISVSPTVDRSNLDIYLGSETFFESYWITKMESIFPRKQRVVFTELDAVWWATQMKKYLKNPDLSWFSSTTEGGHCRVESDIYCPKLFDPEFTKSGNAIEFRIIGSKLNFQDWQLLNSAHETVHLYQVSQGMSHWANWYIEGQATFFELAMAQLLFSSDHVRRDYLFTRPAREDSLKFSPKSISDVTNFLEKCDLARNGECDNFKYGVGSMFHEKLVVDHGLTKYFEWLKLLSTEMPKGNSGGFSDAKQRLVSTKFDQCFSRTFGISRAKWISSVLAPYLFDTFG